MYLCKKKIYMLFIKQSSVEDSPVVIHPNVLKDERGYFMETFKEKEFFENVGNINFIQENESCSTSGVFRGLHFQKPPYEQAKLVRVVKGAVIDFIVDIRKGSPDYGKVFTVLLSEENKRQFYVPAGFAHGFYCIKDAIFQYKCSNYYNKESEGGIFCLSPRLMLKERLGVFMESGLLLSEKDKKYTDFENFDSPFDFKNH